MFEQKKLILLITRGQIIVKKVVLSEKPKSESLGEYDWTSDALPHVLKTIRKVAGKKARVLLSDSLTYVTHVSIPEKTKDVKVAVQEKSQELIPENLNELVWDYKGMLTTPGKKDEGENTVHQVIAMVGSFFQTFSKAIAISGMQIEAVEPLSTSLARQTKGEKTPLLIGYLDYEPLILCADGGMVVASELVKEQFSQNTVESFLTFVKKKYDLSPKKLMLSESGQKLDLTQFQNAERECEIWAFNPFLSVASLDMDKNDPLNLSISKMDEKKLPSKEENIPDVASKEKNQPPRSRIRQFLLFALITLGAFLLVTGLLYYRFSTKKIPVATKSKSIITPSLFPLSPTPVASASAYSIIIENGSIKEGEATRLSETLKSHGYNVIGTGNADKNDYVKTEIHFQKSVPDSFKIILDKLIKSLYDNYVSTSSATNKSDVLIIIGQ